MGKRGQIILDVTFGVASIITGAFIWGTAINSQLAHDLERRLGPLGAPLGALRQITNQTVFDRSGEDV